MNAIGIIGGILILVACCLVIACISLMEAGSGLGTIAGDSGSFFDQNRGKTKDAMLKRAVWIGGAFLAVMTLLVLFFG